jgi:DNA-binding transcriptional ArsR family regulator
MLDMLAMRECTAGEFVDAFPHLSQPSISQHLRALREARLVEVRPEGQKRIYSLRSEGLREVEGWLARFRRLRDQDATSRSAPKRRKPQT